MPTQLSSPFEIVTDAVNFNGVTVNLATSRAMRIVAVSGTGLNNAVITVSKVSAAGALTQVSVITLATGDLNDGQGVMDVVANCTLLASDTLRIVGSAANSTRCVFHCIAAAGAVIVES